MQIVYLVKEQGAAAKQDWGLLAREMSRLGYAVGLEFGSVPTAAPGFSSPDIVHLVGWPIPQLNHLGRSLTGRPRVLVLEFKPRSGSRWFSRLFGRPARVGKQPGLSQAGVGFVARDPRGRRFAEELSGDDDFPILNLSPGVDAEHFRFQAEGRRLWRERLGLRHWETLCLQIGPLRSREAARRILTAAAPLLREGRVTLALLNHGPRLRREMVTGESRRLGVLHRVKFLDAVAPESLPDLFSAADLGLAEGADPALAVAAMSCRLPLLPAVESDLAWWRMESATAETPADFHSWRGLKLRLRRLVLEPGLRAELGGRARWFVETECAWSAQARKLARWYQELAAEAFAGEAAAEESRLAA